MSELHSESSRLSALSAVVSGTAMMLSAEGKFLEVVGDAGNNGPFGDDPDDLVGQHLTDIVSGVTAERFQNAVAAALETGEVQTMWADWTVSNDRRPFEGRITVLERTRDDGYTVVWFAEDITERVTGYNTPAHPFEEGLNHSPLGHLVVDPSGAISFANDRAGAILGLGRDELRCRTYTQSEWNFTHSDGTPVTETDHPVTRVFETGTPVFRFGHWIERPDGAKRWLSTNATPVLNSDQRVTHVVVSFEDVTELKTRERRFHCLADAQRLAHVSCWLLDSETDIMEWSGRIPLIQETDEYSCSLEDELENYDPEDGTKLRRAITNCWERGTPFCFELPRRTERGHRRWVTFSGELVEECGMKLICGVVRDVTVQKELEQRVAVFDRVLRHDLRNRLNVILGHADLVNQRLADIKSQDASPDRSSSDPVEQAIQTSVSKIIETSEQICSLADTARQLQDSLRKGGGYKLVDLQAIVTGLSERLEEQCPDATISINSSSVTVLATEHTIRQILENAVAEVMTYNEQQTPHVTLDISRSDAAHAVLSVEDNGLGIPMREQGIVADGGGDALCHGIGIGFWTLHWLTLQLGGEVEIVEGDSSGTTLKIILPAVASG